MGSKKIRNTFDEIVKKTQPDGKMKTIDPKESFAIAKSINDELTEYRRELQVKARESQDEASKIVITS